MSAFRRCILFVVCLQNALAQGTGVPQKQAIAKGAEVEYLKALKFAELETLHSAIQYETRLNFHKKQLVSALLAQLSNLRAETVQTEKVRAGIIKARLMFGLRAAKKEMKLRSARIEHLQGDIRQLQSLQTEKLTEFDVHEQVRMKQSAQIVHMRTVLHSLATRLQAAQAKAAANPQEVATEVDAAHSAYLLHLEHVLALKKSLEAHEAAKDKAEGNTVAALKAKLVTLDSELASGTGPEDSATEELQEQLAALNWEMGNLTMGLQGLQGEAHLFDAQIEHLRSKLAEYAKA